MTEWKARWRNEGKRRTGRRETGRMGKRIKKREGRNDVEGGREKEKSKL